MAKEPSKPTVKRLFAVAGNRCAYPRCITPNVDPASGSIIGEIAHIRGRKPDSPRYDPTQSDEERHGFDNLLLLCGTHHKVVDDDPDAYTVERLLRMKREHGATVNTVAEPTDEVARQIIFNIEHRTINAATSNVAFQSGGGTILQAGVVQTLNIHTRGKPSPDELGRDIEVATIPVSFTGETPTPHHAGVRVAAKQYDHPNIYVRITASKPINERCLIHQPPFTGVRNAIATAINGNVLEHTEGHPGLEPGQPWLFVVFADQPVEITDVHVEDRSRFSEVADRIRSS